MSIIDFFKNKHQSRQNEQSKQNEQSRQDITITCRECGKDFIFSAEEQEFFASHGFKTRPSCCLDCRRQRIQQRLLEALQHPEKHEHKCVRCGRAFLLLMHPSPNAELYCPLCLPMVFSESDMTLNNTLGYPKFKETSDSEK